MGISINYSAIRNKPLSAQEENVIKSIAELSSLCDVASEISLSEKRFNGEDFVIFKKSNNKNEIFSGATTLPSSSEEHLWFALQRWCEVLTKIRKSIPNAKWQVHVDAHEIMWDETAERYDPCK